MTACKHNYKMRYTTIESIFLL